MRFVYSLLILSVLGLICVQGCSKAGAQSTARAEKSAKAGAANPDEELDEARMADAFKGLSAVSYTHLDVYKRQKDG